MADQRHQPSHPRTRTDRTRGPYRPVRRPRPRRGEPTALQTAAASFTALTAGPKPLALDGAAIGYGLPARLIGLAELRSILCHPATGRACRDAAWRILVTNARTGAPEWMVGAAGVALPALRKMAAELAEGYRGDRADVDSAVLTGFIEGVGRIDVDRPGVITRLRWMTYRAGIKARYTRDGIAPMPLPPLESQPPPAPWGHPDLILFDAVAKGVLSPLQAELIGRSRLENLTLKAAAAELGVGYQAARKARQRGEARLTAALVAGDVEHQLSPSRAESGLHPTGGGNRKPGVRGRSTRPDGTSDADGSGRKVGDEKGVFCGPARRPSPADVARVVGRRSARRRHPHRPEHRP